MAEPRRILLVDDDESLLRVTEKQLASEGYRVTAVRSGADALEAYEAGETDLVVTDVQMPGMDGISLLAELKRRDPNAVVIVITAYGSVERAVEAMKTGATDFLEKPFRREALVLAVEKGLRYRTLAVENLRLRAELADRFSFDKIVGGSKAMEAVFRTLARVAASDAPVLVRGESGTGKELVARAIHDHGGTLFLDEIGEMRPEVQAKLLRVIADGEVRPVGAEESRRVDVRLVTATNRDLETALEEKAFRRDLYYRIAVVTIELPPLRDRPDDIPLLANHFLAGRTGGAVRMDPEFLAALRRYRWPGNVRELENVIERALVLREDEGRLRAEDLPAHVRGAESAPDPIAIEIPDGGLSLAEVEKSLIRRALEKADGNQSKAARLLGITRQTLLYRLAKHDLK